METMWSESNSRTPLIGFLSMGSDPTENIERLAKQKGFSKFLPLDSVASVVVLFI
jgi:dynein heavy chain